MNYLHGVYAVLAFALGVIFSLVSIGALERLLDRHFQAVLVISGIFGLGIVFILGALS